jgi:hypothetical protein
MDSVITTPHSYQGQLPEGAAETIYVKAEGSANEAAGGGLGVRLG